MHIRPIKTAEDYEAALSRVEALVDAEPGTEAADELDVLATLVEAWERKHFPIAAPDPVDAIMFRMEQMGLEREDLEPLLGSRGRVSDVLNRRRGLSIAQIRNLHTALGIPYENLIGEG